MSMHRLRTSPPHNAHTGGVIITENGCAVAEDSVQVAVNDEFRAQYFRDYLIEVHAAIALGADVRGYFAWSLLDNFEWALGYTKRFACSHIHARQHACAQLCHHPTLQLSLFPCLARLRAHLQVWNTFRRL